MATNLRLGAEAAEALRAAARASGRSQQDLLRDAVDRFLGIGSTSARERAVASGLVRAPAPFVDTEPTVRLSDGESSLDLLERDDR
ncbi:MAG: ribbon-helix-helix protein, CopG family [Nocardioidaceae bacterium]|nr:ribbon-helix-helix protein, CopG family [Nocardioidaceae bacterium]